MESRADDEDEDKNTNVCVDERKLIGANDSAGMKNDLLLLVCVILVG